MRKAVALVALLLVSCAGHLTGPTSDQKVWWQKARTELESYGLRTCGPEHTTFIPVGGMFRCGGGLAVGCYIPSSRTIHYSIEHPQVLQHEAEHAILHQMNYPRLVYHCIPEHHDEPECEGWPWHYGTQP